MHPARRLFAATIAAIAATACLPAFGQAFPSKPVRILVPFPAGSAADALARGIAPKLQSSLGQPVIVENRPGANALVGLEAVARAAPDGYTIGLGTSGTHGINSSLLDRLPYDPVKDFVGVTTIYSISLVMSAAANHPASSLRDLLDRQKGTGDVPKLGYFGTVAQVTAEQIRLLTGLRFQLVPYRTAASMLADLLGGHIDLMIETSTGSLPQLRGGRIKGLAISSPQRSVALPNVPTVAEQGYPGFQSVAWAAFFVPAGTPAPIVERLSADTVKILRDQEFSDSFAQRAMKLEGNTPAEMVALVRNELATWERVFREAKIPKATQ